MKILPRLSEIYENNPLYYGVLTCSNVDDIFKEVVTHGIEKLEVTREEMFIITQFSIASATPAFNGTFEKINWLVWRALAEGKVDKFFGVKLKLIK